MAPLTLATPPRLRGALDAHHATGRLLCRRCSPQCQTLASPLTLDRRRLPAVVLTLATPLALDIPTAARSIDVAHNAASRRARALGLPPRMAAHVLRRGAAQHLAAQGCSVAALRRAGGWRSAAFAVYLQLDDLQAAALAQSLADDSDSDLDA